MKFRIINRWNIDRYGFCPILLGISFYTGGEYHAYKGAWDLEITILGIGFSFFKLGRKKTL